MIPFTLNYWQIYKKHHQVCCILTGVSQPTLRPNLQNATPTRKTHLEIINQSTNQSTHPSINQSINQSINHLINPSINHSIHQSSAQSSNQPINQQIKPINPSINKASNESIRQQIKPNRNQNKPHQIWMCQELCLNTSTWTSFLRYLLFRPRKVCATYTENSSPPTESQALEIEWKTSSCGTAGSGGRTFVTAYQRPFSVNPSRLFFLKKPKGLNVYLT